MRREQEELDRATVALRAVLADGPVPWRAARRLVCQSAHCGPTTVYQACGRLGVVTARYMSPEGYSSHVWRMPDQPDPLGVHVTIEPQRDDERSN